MSDEGSGPEDEPRRSRSTHSNDKSVDEESLFTSGKSSGSLEREWDLHQTQFGETPIDEDAREFLTEKYRNIRTKDELNFAESNNIALAMEWLEANPYQTSEEFLNQGALKSLHRRMFGDVWTWAGQVRVRETNMGVDPVQIVAQWEDALRDARWQIDQRSYPPEEICVRLHRRMLAIHCFANGNGRHARVVANELGRLLGLGPFVFTWGAGAGRGREEEMRREYLDALHLADTTGDYGPLVRIALS